MPNKKNWDQIRKQKATDTVKYRDVYEEQQLERGKRQERQSMLSRNILNGFLCALAFLIVWSVISAAEYLNSGKGEIEASANPAYTWVRVQEHYENVNDASDKISVKELENLKAEFNKNYDPSLPVVEQPKKPKDPENSDQYERKNGVWVDVAGREVDMASLKKTYEKELKTYDKELEKYNRYLELTTDPEWNPDTKRGTYRYIREHYRNRNDVSNAIEVSEYNELVQDYENSELGEDISDVPDRPYCPSELYKEELVPNTKNKKQYRHVLDGHVISSKEYEALQDTYVKDLDAYKDAYLAHRKKFHPDDIDGTKKVFSMQPTKLKVLISSSIAVLLFGILYIFFRKNLDTQNLLTDTSDINQYENDQHIALPEEIQRNYDWFPDVGAHSAVQVSSMISHMALTNKGLKQVQLAKRAEKDIFDEDGDIEYYKGEIIHDENGEPITSTVPIIDEKFMDALFDASGAPKDKNVRKKYDTTKIPYNPDGSNRDKLGKYNTVADLINDDWEFPLYEPQRPGGAYIVDTAPVNTMVLAIKKCIA